MKEGHMKLKVGGSDVLHCYYAHVGENESFKRRSYSMLDQAYKHIVLVHYLEVKGNKKILGHDGVTKEVVPSSLTSNSASSRCLTKHNVIPPPVKHITILNSTQKSEHEAAESGEPSVPSFSFTQGATENIRKQKDVVLGKSLTDKLNIRQEVVFRTSEQDIWQVTSDDSSEILKWPMDQKLHDNSNYDISTRFHEKKTHPMDLLNASAPFWTHPEHQSGHLLHNDLPFQLSDAELGSLLNSNLEDNLSVGDNVNHSSAAKPPLLDNCGTDELKKVDSFSRWMSKELGEVDESHQQSSSAVYWDEVESENAVADSSLSPQVLLDSYLLSPSLSQVQLFSIIDFSPNWAYGSSETKVLISGKFLKSRQDAAECKWSCMFGEVEVPVEVLEDGVLRCHSPSHRDGRFPFYITCSNRLACSEVREFEFRDHPRDSDMTDLHRGSTDDMLLHIRLGKLLSLGSDQMSLSSSFGEKPSISCKISSLMEQGEDEWLQMVKLISGEFSSGKLKEQLLQKILKEKLHDWLLHKANEDGKGPSVLDEEGQGVIHLSAALGYDWVMAPTIAAGVNINFRDVNGWTALHWAALHGREHTVGALVSLGAAPGALTDPTSEFPSGRTPADLASGNGHRGIAGYLAESSLTTHLSSLALKDIKDNDVPESSSLKAIQTASERVATPLCDGEVSDVSLKDSLTAVRNAAQTAARIYQVFRVRSFHDSALPPTSVKTHIPGQPNVSFHTAAVQIQNKFREWKGRKDFLLIRQQIIKIQAHVRGHQVRNRYKKILWSVGIVEKVILRWGRKGSGLRGFRLATDIGGTTQIEPAKADEYDFLKEGRKQTEERLQKALARVKSMVQYPEARDQYHRLLNVVTEFKEAKVMNDRVLNSSQEACDAMAIDFEPFLRDDTFMSTIKSLLEFDDGITSSAAMVIPDHSIPSSSTLTSPKKSSRRFVQKRVVFIPIGDMYGSALNGDGAPPSDSWAWRKYNQKLIEGSPYVRGYYQCCSSSEGCTARKLVERSKEDPTMLMITYAYEHNHPMPASRNFKSTTTAATRTNNNTTSTASTNLLPEEPVFFCNQPKIQPDEKTVNLRDESLVSTIDHGWFSDVASTSSTILERPICLDSTNKLEGNMPMISPMGEGDEPLFPDLGELPEFSLSF